MGLLTTIRLIIARRLAYQKGVMTVMSVLPGKYSFKQVHAAIQTAGVAPYEVSISLMANNETDALRRFYDALEKR